MKDIDLVLVYNCRLVEISGGCGQFDWLQLLIKEECYNTALNEPPSLLILNVLVEQVGLESKLSWNIFEHSVIDYG